MIVGRKGSICPKRDSSRARNGRHIQKWGRKGFMCPKRDNIGQERVGTSKNGAGKGSCVQKGTIPGEKGSVRPKTGQEVVRVSKKGRFQARRGWHVQKWGRKGFACPKWSRERSARPKMGQKVVGASKNGAGRGPCIQKG